MWGIRINRRPGSLLPMLGSDTRFITGTALGMWQANCYVLGDVEAGTAVVVDPGQGAQDWVAEQLAARGVRCEAVLLTHGHLDHLWAVPEVVAGLDAPVLLHVDDRYLWDDPAKAFGNLPPGALEAQFGLVWDPPDDALETFTDGTTFSFAGLAITARHTPGHTPGSSVFLLTDTGQDDPLLLSGDLIFAGSVGRTDFPRGSAEQQMDAIARVVLPLDDATLILSGHGGETTVGTERATNPFLRAIA
jgi:glyoxylase-like metal-dependent hydrolase (beta-lactamase superfamily II)